jgi:hypothetical protein
MQIREIRAINSSKARPKSDMRNMIKNFETPEPITN